MLKKIVISISLAMIVFLYSWGDFSLIKEYCNKIFILEDILPEYPKNTTIHIYVESATFPTELQLIDIIQRSKDTPKIISLHKTRFPNLKGLENYNATVLDFGFRELYDWYSKKKVRKLVKELKSLKDNDFVIHANIYWPDSLFELLKEIPREKIKHIYLYEDGLGNHVAGTAAIPIFKEKNAVDKVKKKIIAGEFLPKRYAYYLHKVYPVTYRISYWDEFKKRRFAENTLEIMNDAVIEDVNISKIADTLTTNQKEELFNIFGFDLNSYKEMIENKNVHFFVIGHGYEYQNEDLFDWYRSHKNVNDILFIKGNDDILNNKLIPAYIFPNQLPFEMLIIGGFMPKTVSGVFSSLFYSLPKENIDRIIGYEGDPNIETIKKVKELRDEQIKILR